jgi:hypothetical protein
MRWAVLFAAAIGSCVIVDLAEARKGGFVSALIRGAVRAGPSSNGPSGDGLGPAFGQKAYGPDTLTPSQLERCVAWAVTLDSDGAQIEQLAGRLEAEKAAIEATQAGLSAEQPKVDRRAGRFIQPQAGRAE